MEKPLVSIIVPTRDRAFFTENVLRNFYRQTYPQKRMELLIYEDGAPSMKEHLPKDKRIKYHHSKSKTPLSIGKKRNKLCSLAKGEIIVQMDDDDFYPPTCVSHIVKSLTPKKYEVACLDDLYVYDLKHDKTIAHVKLRNPTHILGFKKSYLNRHKFRNEDRVCEESFFLERGKTKITTAEGKKCLLMIAHYTNVSEKEFYFTPQTQTRLTLESFMKEKEDLIFFKEKIGQEIIRSNYYENNPEEQTWLLDSMGKTFNFMAACGAAERKEREREREREQ